MERVNVMIAGGGVIGSAMAMCLAKRGVLTTHRIPREHRLSET
ncbi:MAG: hypothetical protein ABGX04_03205 [Myxococcales bacterium]